MQLPATFGKYELLEHIATGGMAEVYLARTFGVAGFEKQLVIKRIRPELAGDPHHIQLFINEARIGVQLNHENVVQVFDLGKVGRDWFIAMEHLHGRDLNKLVKVLRADGERLPLPLAAYVVAEVCRGLAYAHALRDADGRQAGLVHRDVSPHNVLLTFAGGVKLVDFGIARLVGAKAPALAERRDSQRPGGGKYAYMSPEQARGDAFDHRTDVFSAGIVLWELIVGHRLFQHPDPAQKLDLVQRAVVPRVADEGIGIDGTLQGILDRALAARPEDRYASAALFEEDLRAWLYEHGTVDPRRTLVDLLRRSFPGEAEQRGHARSLQRMLADMALLGGSDGSLGEASASRTPSRAATEAGPVAQPDQERKRVVALYLEIDGLTQLSRQLEPEQLFRRRFRVLRWLRQTVDPFDGRVQSAIDDQILVLFGVPRTRPDDLARALECAMELQRSVGALHDRGLPISVAIGIHAGDVTVDRARRQTRYVARGDTTRLARRLAAYADHGEVLITRRVLDGTHTLFRCRSGPDIPLRGGRPPTPSFVVEGRRHGLRVAQRGPWLRRGAELERIRAALTALQGGTGSTLVLTGEIGSGKSRLAREVHALAVRRAVPAYLAAARPWGEHPPLEILRDLVLDLLGLDSDAPRAQLATAAERLPQLGLGPAEMRGIESLIRARTGSPGSPGHEDLVRAVERTLRGLARDRAAIVILEDVHHLPAPEQEIVAQLLRRLRHTPLLFLLTCTGELPAALEGLGPAVALHAFEAEQTERLTRALLDATEVDPLVLDLLERTCEGNPLYVEEMVKFLLHEGHLALEDGRASLVARPARAALPESIAALLAARIDLLEPAAKGALQLAATIGQTFSVPLLAAAMGLDDPTPVISELTGHGLIRTVDREQRDARTFTSELVREAARRTTLGVQRRTYNRLVAEAIEHLHRDDLDPHLETLAAHCAQAGREVDAARYLHRAGQAQERAMFLERARDLYERGLTVLRAAAETPDTWDARTQGEAMLCLRSGATSRLLGDERAAERSLRLALDISGEAGLSWIELRAHLELGRLYLSRGKLDLADAHVAQAGALARLDGDVELRREAIEAQANLAYERNDPAQAAECWSQAMVLSEGDAQATARCKLGMATGYLREGALDRARLLLDEALRDAEQAGDRILIGRALNNRGLLHYWAGDYDEALRAFRQALQVREGIGYLTGVVVNQHNIGDVHLTRGDLARAWVAFDRSRELAEQMGWRRGVVLNEVYLGFIDASERDLDEGLARIESAIDEARELGDAEVATNGALIAARLLGWHGEPDRARALLASARAEATEHGLSALLPSIEELEAELAGPSRSPTASSAPDP